MKRMALLALALLSACTPRISEPTELPVRTLDAADGAALTRGFNEVFEALGVRVVHVDAFSYDGVEGGAFEQALARFYRRNPGFCPLENAFFTRGEDLVYLTLTANGTLVRGFVYDQSNRPALRFAYVEGVSDTPLPKRACR